MPFVHSIDADAGVITTVATGIVSLADISEYIYRLRSDPEFKPQYSRLVDALGMVRVTFQPEDLIEIARMFAAGFSGENTRAAIAVTDGAIFDFARGFEMLTTRMGQDVAVFRDLEQARAWLRAGTV